MSMKRILNYIYRIKLSKVFSLHLFSVLLGATLFLIWYAIYVSNTNVSTVRVKYRSVNLSVDSLACGFYVNCDGLRNESECDRVELQEYSCLIDSAKCLPVRHDSLHRHYYRKSLVYYEGTTLHESFRYVFPEEYDVCPSGHRYSDLSVFEIQGHRILDFKSNASADSIRSDIQHYGLDFIKWIDRYVWNYRNFKGVDVAYGVFSYRYMKDKSLSERPRRTRTISARGYMFHDFHPNFNYNVEFDIEGLGYDDSVMHHIPMTIIFHFNRRKRYLMDVSPEPDSKTAHSIEYHSKEKIVEILRDGITISGTDVYVKEHFDKKSTLVTLVVGVLLSLLSSKAISDMEKKKVANGYSSKYWLCLVGNVLKGMFVALCCILAYIAIVNPYTWD